MENINGLQVYLKQIKDIPLLTANEEKELAIRYQRGGDKSAKAKLVSSNLRLVVMAAKHYSARTSISFEDLVQEGNFGLMRAVDTFNPELGWRFSTYAMNWIKQAISRAILNQSRTIRIPIHILELQSKYNKAQKEYFYKYGKEPNTAEIAAFMGVEVKKIKEIEELVQEPVSLNTSLNDEDDGTVEDLVADPNADRPDDRMDNELLGKALDSVLNTLDKREKEIVIARFGLGNNKAQTLDQLGVTYGLTKERIRQIEQKALKKLRNPARANTLRAYL